MSAEQNENTALNIVVADDDVDILGLVVQHLEIRFQANVTEASNGEEALERVKELKPDLVILDVMMPGMSGWEVCRAIREDESTAGLKVLMLTGIGERLNEMTSPLYGADAHLDKPFDLEVLEDHVRTLTGAS